MYGLPEGLGGTHCIVQSWEARTAITPTGKNKGKSLGFGKYQDMVSEVVNNILPIYKKQLDTSGHIPSGKLDRVRRVGVYQARVLRNARRSNDWEIANSDAFCLDKLSLRLFYIIWSTREKNTVSFA